jgi:hypothetical protein
MESGGSPTLPNIPLEDTPIFTQLTQEYAAREIFAQHFGPEVRLTPLNEAGEAIGETFSVRGGSITVYGSPIE